MPAFAHLANGLRLRPLTLLPRSTPRRPHSTRSTTPVVRMVSAPPSSTSSSSSSSSSPNARAAVKRKQVAAVIIGNEILNGKTTDTNLGTLARHVESRGAVLARATTIRDQVDEIARVVASLSESHDLVFTSGGIGPTLDDVTYAGVAAAFGRDTRRHEATVQRMRSVQPEMELNGVRLRMATLPHPCDDVVWTDELWVPLAVVHNVYVLPGIPRLFARMLGSVPDERFGRAERRARAVVLCRRTEGDLAELLDRVAARFEGIAIGSYPATTARARERYTSMVTVEGDFGDEVRQAAEIVREGVDGWFEMAEAEG